jgi:hypothetical protein
MKRVLASLALVCSLTCAFGQDSIRNMKLKLKIDSLFSIDQQVQEDIILGFQNGISMDSFLVLEKKKNETFARHIPIIKSIYNTYGYPSIEMVGAESSSHFFTLIQHADADPAFQSTMLPTIKKLAKRKEVSGSDFAYLYDRVQINTNKKQLYGTQLDYDSTGKAFAKNLKNPKMVNKRRKKMGLDTLENYLNLATEIHKMQNTKKEE